MCRLHHPGDITLYIVARRFWSQQPWGDVIFSWKPIVTVTINEGLWVWSPYKWTAEIYGGGQTGTTLWASIIGNLSSVILFPSQLFSPVVQFSLGRIPFLSPRLSFFSDNDLYGSFISVWVWRHSLCGVLSSRDNLFPQERVVISGSWELVMLLFRVHRSKYFVLPYKTYILWGSQQHSRP